MTGEGPRLGGAKGMLRAAGVTLALAAAVACGRGPGDGSGGPSGKAGTGAGPAKQGAPDAAPCRRDAGCGTRWSIREPTIYHLWGSAPDDIWAVGSHGTILHFDGRAWQRVASGTTGDLGGIAGRGRGDAWIIGGGRNATILRLRGATWTPEALHPHIADGSLPSDTMFSDIWVAANGDVWVAGIARRYRAGEEIRHGVLGRHQGGRWTFDHDPDLNDGLFHVWGTGPDDVWARGSATTVHWNGRYVIKHPRKTPPPRRGRHGFAGGWRHLPNHLLTHPRHPPPPKANDEGHYNHFWAFGADDVWAATYTGLYHFDGRAWTTQPVVPSALEPPATDAATP